MVQTSVESYQEEQRSLWRQLIQFAVLLVAGLFLAILVTVVVPGLGSTAHAQGIFGGNQANLLNQGGGLGNQANLLNQGGGLGNQANLLNQGRGFGNQANLLNQRLI